MAWPLYAEEAGYPLLRNSCQRQLQAKMYIQQLSQSSRNSFTAKIRFIRLPGGSRNLIQFLRFVNQFPKMPRKLARVIGNENILSRRKILHTTGAYSSTKNRHPEGP